MVGYPESLTDPSYHSQILILTYPLIGNYGIPALVNDEHNLPTKFESSRIWAAGLVVGEYCHTPSHWESKRTLAEWLKEQNIPGICSIDTRELTKKIREKGTILGKIIHGCPPVDPMKLILTLVDPNKRNLVNDVSTKKCVTYNKNGSPKICAVDCGIKYNQIRCLVSRGACVEVVPWNHSLDPSKFDGLFLSNGPGDPQMCKETITNLKRLLNNNCIKPIFGICLGHQLLASAINCKTYKMK